jgi:hypothetical protein
MRIVTVSHLYGEIVAEHGFPTEYDSLLSALGSLDPPLRPLAGFKSSGRPLQPKRHARTIAGQKKPFLLPVDQAALNRHLDETLRTDGWQSQPVASSELISGAAPLGLRGDFVRNRVFVEVEFGNVASMYRDFFKFQIASLARTGDVGVLILATERLAKFFDSGVTTFEVAERLLPYLSIGIQMPIWFIGIEPEDYGPIGERYEEMRKLCEENGLSCHPFDIALGAPIPVEQESSEAADEAHDSSAD